MSTQPEVSRPAEVSRRALDIEDYLDIARRHMTWMIAPLYAGTAVAVMVAFSV